MKRLVAAGLLALSGASLTGCSYVTSANPGMTTATGEAWYTKDKFFLVFHLGSDVYFCPKGAGKCYLAQVQ